MRGSSRLFLLDPYLKEVNMEGIEVLQEIKEPLRHLPKDYTNLTICLKFVGGVGDAIIGIGSVANQIKNCIIFASTMPHQKRLIMSMCGVDNWIRPQLIHRPEVRKEFDVLIDLAGALNNSRELLADDYYSLIEKRVGISVRPGCFNFVAAPQKRNNRPIIALHPGASNLNRRWSDSKWQELAYQLVERGFYIFWLGTKDEFGFIDENIEKLSDTDEDLLWQARQLAICSYFIGTDSGFCHVAGVLSIKGTVLFGNTLPSSVISRYTSLCGVSAYEKLGLIPTRSLKEDTISKQCMNAIEVEEVLSAIDCSTLEKQVMGRKPQMAKRWKVAVVSNTLFGDDLVEFLNSFCEVTRCSNLPERGFDILIVEDEKGCIVRTTKESVRVNKTNNFENIRRAIREVFLKDED